MGKESLQEILDKLYAQYNGLSEDTHPATREHIMNSIKEIEAAIKAIDS